MLCFPVARTSSSAHCYVTVCVVLPQRLPTEILLLSFGTASCTPRTPFEFLMFSLLSYASSATVCIVL